MNENENAPNFIACPTKNFFASFVGNSPASTLLCSVIMELGNNMHSNLKHINEK